MPIDSVVLVNLRVLAKLQPGDRLQCCDSRYFGIDRGYFTFIYRWLKADTRQITLERLEETVAGAAACPEAKKLLGDARSGMQHLLETYHTDPTTVARLEAIIVRMHADDELEL